MSVQVNPPPILRIPAAFRKDPAMRNYFEQQRQILFQLWDRTGGGDDAIADVQNSELYETGIQFPIEDDLPVFDSVYTDKQVWRSYSTSVDVPAHGFDFIAATQKLEIKLPQYPDEDDIVSVVNVNGKQITVNGNGNLINGETCTVSKRKNSTINYHYFSELSAWYMR